MIVYHGTTLEIRKPDIRHSKSHMDFGTDFYTTSFQTQAERWALRKGIQEIIDDVVKFLESYEVKP